MRIISFLISNIPRQISLKIGSYFGVFVKIFIKKRKDVALKNIKQSFPNLNPNEHLKILNDTYKHFGKILFEFLSMPYFNKRKLNKIISIDKESLKILSDHQSGIILTAHFGNWELIQPIFNVNDLNLVLVAQVQRNKGANKFFTWARKQTKANIIFKKESISKMFKVLKKNYLGLAIDQYAGKSGVPVTFFGKQTSSPIGPSLFHLKAKVPMFVGFCILKSNNKYEISFKKLIIENLAQDIKESSILINQKFNYLLENEIKKYPEQFFWFHRKWR